MHLERIFLPGGHITRAHVLPEVHGALNTVQYHIIVVPGNPGIGSFYLPFARDLHARLNGRFSVRCVDLAGFSAEDFVPPPQQQQQECNHGGHSHTHSVPAPPVKLYSLQEQCAIMHEYLRALQLQLLAADELSRSPVAPAGGSIPAAAARLISPYVQGCSSTLPAPRQHMFILVAHSIGAFIALDVLRRSKAERSTWNDTEGKKSSAFPVLDAMASYLSSTPSTLAEAQRLAPPVQVAHAFLLFPFIRMELSWLHFHALRLLVSCYSWLPSLLARLGKLLPLSLLKLLLRLTSGITSEHALSTVRSMSTTKQLLQQSAFFAHTEFQDVLRAASPVASSSSSSSTAAVTPAPAGFQDVFLSAHAAETTLFYAGLEHDVWGPLSQMQDFQRRITGLNAHVVPTASHAWCAYVDQSATMAQLVARDLSALELQWLQQQGLTVAAARPPIALPPADNSTATRSAPEYPMRARL